MTMAFDTLKFARLEQVGVPRDQAEAHAELARDMIIADIATKADLVILGNELRAEMKLVEQHIIIRIGAMIVAAVGTLAVIQKLF
jgi:hypothetical protein